jgi:hypothetical protein
MINRKISDTLCDDVIKKIKMTKAYQKYAEQLCDKIHRSKYSIWRECCDIEKEVETTLAKQPDLLDRHKSSACVIVTFLNKLDENLTWAGIPHPKEILAIVAGLTALRTSIECDNRNHKNAGIIAVLKANKGFKFPTDISGSIPYAQNWALELYHAHKDDRLHILSLSHELFYIEVYNRLLAQ